MLKIFRLNIETTQKYQGKFHDSFTKIGITFEWFKIILYCFFPNKLSFQEILTIHIYFLQIWYFCIVKKNT